MTEKRDPWARVGEQCQNCDGVGTVVVGDFVEIACTNCDGTGVAY